MTELIASLRLLNLQVWVQVTGRFLCQIGFGLISFYIPILFVNQIGLSATSVGFSVGLSALSEVSAHFVGGALADSPRFGRKAVLSVAAGLGIVVSCILALGSSLLTLTIACLLLGLSLGCYWTASSAAVMDATHSEERHQAFAVMGVGEYLGIGIGVLGGGGLLAFVKHTPQLLFVGCGLIFLAFLLLIQLTMTAQQPVVATNHSHQGILTALKDKLLVLFLFANIFYTTYVALITSTVPLYFTNFIAATGTTAAASMSSTANLFTWCYIGVGAVLQLPVAQAFASFRRVRVLMIAMLLWAIGFLLLWITGTFATAQFIWGIAALCVLSIASVTYKPFAAAIVSDLAPESLRGAYMAVSSQSWTIGYFIGPTLGGWAMDQLPAIAHNFWLVVAMSSSICVMLLWLFATIHPAVEVQTSKSQEAV